MNELNNQINIRQEAVLLEFIYEKEYSISEIPVFILDIKNISLATLKRDLNKLEAFGYLKKTGVRRALTYSLTGYGLLHRPFTLEAYSQLDEQKKRGMRDYNFSLFVILDNEEIFTKEELHLLSEATKKYKEKSHTTSETIQKKELERFIIELSWKSSKIEGNTYTLLDTEKLLRDGVISPNYSKDEALMIINHKKAFEYVVAKIHSKTTVVSLCELENIHKILVKDLGVNHGIRKGSVGITGSIYLPLSLPQAIENETKKLTEVIVKKKDSFSKALIAILCIGYLQPFEDGNKRTSRLFGNAILLEESLAPLSYRSVDEKKYREAMLVFYEQNSINAFKKIFIEQYIFSCENYNLEKI
jgi:Fic family protein